MNVRDCECVILIGQRRRREGGGSEEGEVERGKAGKKGMKAIGETICCVPSPSTIHPSTLPAKSYCLPLTLCSLLLPIYPYTHHNIPLKLFPLFNSSSHRSIPPITQPSLALSLDTWLSPNCSRSSSAHLFRISGRCLSLDFPRHLIN